MSRAEMEVWREQFEEAAARLGWEKEEITVEHERQWDCSWVETEWRDQNGVYLFFERDLSLGMLKQIIRLSRLVKVDAAKDCG